MTNLYTAQIKPELGTYRLQLPYFYKVLGITTDSNGKIIVVYLQDRVEDEKEVIFYIMDIADVIPPRLKYLASVSPNQGQLFHVFMQQV